MRGTLLVLSLLATLMCVFGAVSQGFFKNDAYPGKCVIDEETILSEGETITRKNCERVSCYSGGMASFATCGVKGMAPPCVLGERKYPDAEYPRCCVNVVHCPDGEEHEA